MIFSKIVDIKFKSFVENIKEHFKQKENVVLFDKRNVIKIIEFENIKYVVKSFKIPHIINKIVYNFFRDSKAKRSYENSLRLIELDVNTPKPIGFSEYKTFFFFKDSFYISEFFDYDFEIRDVFNDSTFSQRKIILEKFVEYSYSIHNKGIYHIDYSPGNILVKKFDDEYVFFIIDVNRMQFLEFDVDLRMKSMSKLTANLEDTNFIAKHYASISGIDESLLLDKFNYYLQEQQNYLENKRRLKRVKLKV